MTGIEKFRLSLFQPRIDGDKFPAHNLFGGNNVKQKMKSLDYKLATVFKTASRKVKADLKSGKIFEDFNKILNDVSDPNFRKLLEQIYSNIARPANECRREMEDTFGSLHGLLERGFAKTASVVFVVCIDFLNTLDLERILSIAPTVICLDKWMKAAKLSKGQVESHLLSQPDQTYVTIGADWLLGHAKPDMFLPLLELFFARHPRPRYLAPWNEALAFALKKDKRGELLLSILRDTWPNQGRIRTLSEVIRSNRELFKTIVDLLPKLLAQEESDIAITEFVNLVFDISTATGSEERKFITVALARLGTGILLNNPRTQNTKAVLTAISKTMRQARNLARGEAVQSDIWVLENLRNEETPMPGKLCVNLQGARYIALAFEKANEGFPVKDILSVTARYMGLTPIGKSGDTVSYDPLQHEDVDGGLIPGERVKILESGWAFNEEAVMRAKVTKGQGGSHV